MLYPDIGSNPYSLYNRKKILIHYKMCFGLSYLGRCLTLLSAGVCVEGLATLLISSVINLL